MSNKLVAADFSNIEGRVLAWLAGEEWKLDAFRAFDAGTGHDLYKITAGGILDKPPEDVTKDERQSHGKVPELALGFAGGPGAFQAMARGYGVDIGASFDVLLRTVPEAVEKAEKAWHARGKRSGMAERAWVSAETVKIRWRQKHPATTAFWWNLQDAALEALDSPGSTVPCGPVKFRKAGSFMFLQLPSGRALCYPYPKPAIKEMPWDGDDGQPAMRRVFSYKGVDSYTRKWSDCYAYGGLWAENVTQAVARDILAEAIVRLEERNYPVVLTVHDECVSEVPLGFGTVDEFCAIMTENPAWLGNCPVTATGWEGPRYKK